MLWSPGWLAGWIDPFKPQRRGLLHHHLIVVRCSSSSTSSSNPFAQSVSPADDAHLIYDLTAMRTSELVRPVPLKMAILICDHNNIKCDLKESGGICENNLRRTSEGAI